jgi:hypothetical protein
MKKILILTLINISLFCSEKTFDKEIEKLAEKSTFCSAYFSIVRNCMQNSKAQELATISHNLSYKLGLSSVRYYHLSNPNRSNEICMKLASTNIKENIKILNKETNGDCSNISLLHIPYNEDCINHFKFTKEFFNIMD